ELLGGPLQQTNVRIGPLHDLAVELEHQPQHPVRRRMLRSEIERVILDVRHDAYSPTEAGSRLATPSISTKADVRAADVKAGEARRPKPEFSTRTETSPTAPPLVRRPVPLLADHPLHQLARRDRDRLVDHALLLGVVAHLHVAADREVLAERMPDETVVGEDATQIGMPLED